MNKCKIDMLLSDSKSTCENIDFSQLNGKKIIITGASGLVGVHLLSSLLYLKQKYNYRFFVLALINSEPEEWFKELIDVGDFSYMRGDLSDVNFIDRLPNVDYIIHAATYGQPMRFMQDQVKTISLNTSTTIALINRLKPNGKFLFISSSEVYSGLQKELYEESDIGTTSPNHPRACYIESKRCGEAICNAYGDNIKIARLCLAYGSGIKMNDTRALHNFVIGGLKNNNIKLMDSGSAKRNYIYIADAVRMLWNIILHGKEKVYNVGGKSETTIRNVAEIIGKELNIPVILPQHDDSLNGAPDSVNLSVSRYENEFGESQSIDLDEGILRVINWCK